MRAEGMSESVEYALQVVPVGTLNPQQLIGALHAPPGFEPLAAQIVPVVLHVGASLSDVHAPKAVSALCFVWKRMQLSAQKSGVVVP